jgi:drug/metabolite transporter (DMT)-like permease
MTSRRASRAMTPLEWSLLLTLAVVWGGSFFFNAVAVRELPVFTVVVARVTLAALVLLAILWLRGERMPRHGAIWLAFFGMGLLNNAIPFSLIVWGQQHIASGLAAILNASTPLFTVVFAHVLTSDERMTGGKSPACLSASLASW